jgi:hypothetical protein
VRKLLLLLLPTEIQDGGGLSLPSSRRAAPVVAPHPGLLLLPDNEIEIPLGAKIFRLCLRLRAFVTLQGILLVTLAHAQIVHFNHHIISLKTPKARICFRLHNNNNNNNNSSLIKMLLLHISVTVTNRVIPTVLNVPPTVSACSTPDSIVPALVDDGFIPNVLDTSFMLVLMAERKVPFCGQHFIIPTT